MPMQAPAFVLWSVLAAGCTLTPQPQPPGLNPDAAADTSVDVPSDMASEPGEDVPDALADTVCEPASDLPWDHWDESDAVADLDAQDAQVEDTDGEQSPDVVDEDDVEEDDVEEDGVEEDGVDAT